jgi:arginine-tRNA-protein transferase
MIIYQRPEFTPPTACPYLPDQTLVYEHFFAGGLDGLELDWLLSRGWRKFGHYYFRPACPECRACAPLRVPVDCFRPTRGQRRVAAKGAAMRVTFGPIRYSDALFDLYQTHSRERFGQDCSFEEFAANLHSPSCPALLASYELDGRLVGAGYLDLGATSLSSVYFVFDPRVSRLSPGVYSVLREMEEARRLGLSHYYLGYLVPGCPRMAYKAAFRPHELYSWQAETWSTAQDPGEDTDSSFSGWTAPD